MDITCHRCQGTLLEALPYCPHCGAPQLTMNSYAQPLASAMEAAEIKAGIRQRPPGSNVMGVDWHAAVIAAFKVTGVAVVLMGISSIGPLSFLSSVAVLWIFVAAFFSVALYHRGAPKALITAGVGAKIGSMVGLFLSSAIVVLTGAGLFLQRYVWQRGDELINEMKAAMTAQNAQMMQQYKLAGITDPRQLATMKQMSDFFISPQGMAVMMLTGMAMMTAFIVIFCVVTGAIGGRLLLRRQNPV